MTVIESVKEAVGLGDGAGMSSSQLDLDLNVAAE
jgi:hypothetical protein